MGYGTVFESFSTTGGLSLVIICYSKPCREAGVYGITYIRVAGHQGCSNIKRVGHEFNLIIQQRFIGSVVMGDLWRTICSNQPTSGDVRDRFPKHGIKDADRAGEARLRCFLQLVCISCKIETLMK